MIDLRSDTVTKPTAAMRQAIMKAEVGDDVYGEDPTVNRLQELVAATLGKEDALLVASGTQGNQVSLLTHCRPGSEIILEAGAHIKEYEAGAAAALAGVQFCALQGMRGAFSPEQVEAAIRDDNLHMPPTSLVCLENTHNRAGGTVLPLDLLKRIHAVTRKHGIPVHMDGARLFNASVASGVPVADYSACADTVQICLSKGLAAPVGSVIAGPAYWINEARRWRKRLGGAMRQAGIFAAAGIVALETMVDRLAEDHENARILAEGLAALPGLALDPELVETNIIVVELERADNGRLVAELKSHGVLVNTFGPQKIRLVTHNNVNRKDVVKALAIIREVLR